MESDGLWELDRDSDFLRWGFGDGYPQIHLWAI
jgi:hypothetical protein